MLPFAATMLTVGLLAIVSSFVNAGAPNEVPAKVLKKIAYHQLLNSCWGKQNNLDFYLEMKEAQDVCLGYKPMFEINVLEEGNDVPVFGLGAEVGSR